MSEAIGSIPRNDRTPFVNSEVKQSTPKCEFRLNAIRELAAQGLCITEIAERLGAPYNSVWRICVSHGVTTSERITHAKRISRQTMIGLRDQGWSKAQVQRHYGIDHNALARLVRRYGLMGHWPGSHTNSTKHRLTAEQRQVGRMVANKLRQLPPTERARYRSLRDGGVSVLKAFEQIAQDRRTNECPPPRQP